MKLTLRDMSEEGAAMVRVDVYVNDHYVGGISLTHDERDLLWESDAVREIEVEVE